MGLILSGHINKATNDQFDAEAAPIIAKAFSSQVMPGIICSTSESDGAILMHREFSLRTPTGTPLYVTASRPVDHVSEKHLSGLDFFSGPDVSYTVSCRIAGRRRVLNDRRTLTGAVQSVLRAQRGIFRTDAASEAV